MLGSIVLIGCSSDSTAHWAHDHVVFATTGDQVTATQVWDLYTRRWERRLAEKHRTCVMTFDLAPVERTADCDGCVVAYDVLPARTDTECVPLADPTLTAALSFGIDAADGQIGSWIDVGFGWERHTLPVAGSWEGAATFTSDFVWELATATSVSDFGAGG